MIMNNVPGTGVTCIGIIMDGNRRWAKAHNLPVFEGHRKGYETLKEVLRAARAAGVAHVVAYAFSTENWNRSEEEVGYLMQLFRSILEHETNALIADRVRVRFAGDRTRFGADMQKLMTEMEQATSASYDTTLHLLMSYGGRAEIVAAARAIAATADTDFTEEAFTARLWSYPMPDPDLVIRTGGEKRLSNFLPWQTTYSELFFLDTYWPDFSKEAFVAVLAEFASRERRHGK